MTVPGSAAISRADDASVGPLTLAIAAEHFPYRQPFRITGHVREGIDAIVVTLGAGGETGRGEAAGVRYRGETVATMTQQIEAVRGAIERGLSRAALQLLLPAGGARNAVDCALWDLEAQLTRRPVWELAGLASPGPLLTTFTCGADTPGKMAEAARSYRGAKAIKLKLTGEREDAERVAAVRRALPDVWLGVDANQGFDQGSLGRLMPVLVANNVALVEQPFRIGEEALFDGLGSPIAIAADESAQTTADLPALAGRVDAVNIKLDKSGGLTEALVMAHCARELGLRVMVGNMGNSSLAIAPAFLVGQLCEIVDLDGPAILRRDIAPSVQYRDGLVDCPPNLWGFAR